jgi:hypothetical protein
MSQSNICKRRSCVTRIGDSTDGASLLSQINAAADAFENEIDLGEYTVNSVPALSEFAAERFVTRLETPVQKLIREFGEEAFYTSVAAVNAYFERPETRTNIKKETYPFVFERVDGPPFSPVEVADFISQYQYTPQRLTFQSGILNNKLISEWENFYNDNLSGSVIGGFCALMPNIFGAIDSFFTALSDIQDFINKIKSFSLNFQANLKALLNNLKNKILQTIDKVVENVKNIIQNFTIENVIQEVTTFVQDRVVKRFHELKEDAKRFFNELNIENIKKRIQGIIDSTMRIFKNPTLEDIQYLIYRFCNLASLVENSFNALLNPLKEFTENLSTTIDILNGRSSINTARAISAGAIRLTPQEARARYDRAPSVERNVGGVTRRVITGDIAPPTDAERANVTPWNNGQGDARVTFTDGMRADPYRVGNLVIGPAELRWSEMEPDVLVLLMRVQARFGKQLTILSAYRDPRQQEALYADFLAGRTGGPVAKPGNSLHESGMALDITWSGQNRESIIQFFSIAAEEGFRTFGDYASGRFVHIDTSGAYPHVYTFGRITRQDILDLGFSLPGQRRG